MSRQGGSEKKVTMVDVEPGEKTGIYYMPICNLPFGTSWQDLKDWLRVDCDVDHVELFQSSTSGWIRLRGEENFNKAWTRLKNEYFRNRGIIASDKNRTESIKIKGLVDSRAAQFGTSARWELAATQAHNPDAVPSPASSCIQEAASLASPLSPDGEFGRLPAPISCPVGSVGSGGPVGPVGVASSIGYGAITVLEPYTAMPEAYNALAAARNHGLAYAPAFGYYEPAPDTSGMTPAAHFGNSPPYGASQPPVDAQYSPSLQSHSSLALATSPPQGPAYAAEGACKVLVASIQHKARPGEVSNWIRHQIGEYSPAIMGMDIPLAEPKGRNRGHALVTLANSAAAEATVRILDQKLFQGRVVSARLMREGATEVERCKPPKEARTPRHHRFEPGKSTKHASATEPGKSSRRAEESRPSNTNHGETPSPHASPPHQDEEYRAGETSQAAGPVIAYGTSTRRSDRPPCL
ncbi:hypothetical protein E4U41_006789 [Claviceps citrina]|nr:hypothetical protein E4U41_006789 [Claviceps citrina]